MKRIALVMLAFLLFIGCAEPAWIYDYGEVTNKISETDSSFLGSHTTWITVINVDKGLAFRSKDSAVFDIFEIGDRVYCKYKLENAWSGRKIVVFATGPDGEKVEQ